MCALEARIEYVRPGLAGLPWSGLEGRPLSHTAPAHIHEGSCANLNPAPKFSLMSVANGASTTEVDGTLQQLTSAPHAIHMHKSPDEAPIYVACADIKLAAAEAG